MPYEFAISEREFNSVFIIENRNLWNGLNLNPDINNDLVLCLDFGLFYKLKNEGFTVEYLDHLLDNDTAEYCNAEMNRYLQNWFKDENNTDLLQYEGFDIGDALLLNVLNDITYYCHFFFNISVLKKIKYQKLFVVVEDKIIADVLDKLNFQYTVLEAALRKEIKPVYNFPIIQWTNEQIGRRSLKSSIKDLASKLFDQTFKIFDFFFLKRKEAVFIQNHYSTAGIIQTLLSKNTLKVILHDYVPQKNIFKQRRVIYKVNSTPEASKVIDNFKRGKKNEWIYEGFNLGQILQEKLFPTVEKNIESAISVIKSINRYFFKNPIHLMIPVTNTWLNNRLIMNYCRNNNVPVFMIINGLLNVHHWQDGHDSTWVNCYSESLRTDYFKDKNNAFPLGDPRMDSYAKKPSKIINRKTPTILIGSAGYNHLDQTSYIAFEFDFLFDVLKALADLKSRGFTNSIIIKVRANGYAYLYQHFVDEYYPTLNATIIQNDPFPAVVAKADLYISFYSQTIIEAAALGIPTIYYKKDNSIMFRPYDVQSELVTAIDIQELTDRIRDFYNNDPVFYPFLDKKILEKYIGPLDGNNLQRNLDFIHSILKKTQTIKEEDNLANG